LLEEGSSKDGELKEQIGRIRALDRELLDLNRGFHQDMTQVLSVRQQARLLLFEERFRRDLREVIREFRGSQHRQEEGPSRERQEE